MFKIRNLVEDSNSSVEASTLFPNKEPLLVCIQFVPSPEAGIASDDVRDEAVLWIVVIQVKLTRS